MRDAPVTFVLDTNQQACLSTLEEHSLPDGERCIYFHVIEAETGLNCAEVRRNVRALAHVGLADRRADGYCITKAGIAELAS